MYGRVCYEGMAAFWGPAAADPGSPMHAFAQRLTALPKVVFSKTLREPTWANTTVAAGDVAEEVARLKTQGGKELVLFGGAEIAGTFMRLGLIDEYRLLLVPTLYGGGTRLFQDGRVRTGLKLVEAKTLDTGSVRLRYHPAKR
jgi:dihydrofolate reductase